MTFRTINPEAKGRVIILCDHAGSDFPHDFGLTPDQRESDVVCDWGARAVAEDVARRTGFFTLIPSFSRLVVDLNRYPFHPECMPEVSQRGFPVPGNAHLSKEARAERLRTYYWPYHDAVTRRVHSLKDTPVIISIHSFAPEYHGVARPWHIGMIYNDDERMSAPFIGALEARGDICVGRNEPYAGFGFTVEHHAVARRAPHIMAEIRQDEIRTPAQQARMADIFCAALIATGVTA